MAITSLSADAGSKFILTCTSGRPAASWDYGENAPAWRQRPAGHDSGPGLPLPRGRRPGVQVVQRRPESGAQGRNGAGLAAVLAGCRAGSQEEPVLAAQPGGPHPGRAAIAGFDSALG